MVAASVVVVVFLAATDVASLFVFVASSEIRMKLVVVVSTDVDLVLVSLFCCGRDIWDVDLGSFATRRTIALAVVGPVPVVAVLVIVRPAVVLYDDRRGGGTPVVIVGGCVSFPDRRMMAHIIVAVVDPCAPLSLPNNGHPRIHGALNFDSVTCVGGSHRQ